MLSIFCVLLGFTWVGLASTLLPLSVSTGCVHNGKTYAAGESFQPSPCEQCFCSGGRALCASAACLFPPCVDVVHDPTKCCPTCPNGANCQHKDGTIIKKGEVYKPNTLTTCMCPSDFHSNPTQVVCTSVGIPVTADPMQVG